MQQGRRRLVGHAVVAIGGTTADAFEQAKHATHAFDAIERADKVHFRGTRIGEADLDAALHQGPNQTLRSVHHAPRKLNRPKNHKEGGTLGQSRAELQVLAIACEIYSPDVLSLFSTIYSVNLNDYLSIHLNS